jgi:hypothetical protein
MKNGNDKEVKITVKMYQLISIDGFLWGYLCLCIGFISSNSLIKGTS